MKLLTLALSLSKTFFTCKQKLHKIQIKSSFKGPICKKSGFLSLISNLSDTDTVGCRPTRLTIPKRPLGVIHGNHKSFNRNILTLSTEHFNHCQINLFAKTSLINDCTKYIS